MTGPADRSASTTGPQSVDRALDILDTLARAPRPVSAKFLARQLECALSTVYNLLGSLTARGHVTRTADGYALGPEVPVLYRAFQRQTALGPLEEQTLRLARDATGAEAYLSTYRAGEIAVLASTSSLEVNADPFPVGRDMSAHATAHGKVLLASVSRGLRQRYLHETGMVSWTERTITDPERFESEVAGVRRRGVAVSIGEMDPAFTCLAVPVPGASRQGVRALSVSLPTADFEPRRRRIAAALTRAAQRLQP